MLHHDDPPELETALRKVGRLSGILPEMIYVVVLFCVISYLICVERRIGGML